MTEQGRPPETPQNGLEAAMSAARRGAYSSAESLARHALLIAEQAGEGLVKLAVLNLLGGITFEAGRIAEAKFWFEATLTLGLELRDRRTAAKVSNNLALIADLEGRPNEAMSLCRSALAVYLRLDDDTGAAQTWHNLGLVLRNQGQSVAAAEAADAAVRFAERSRDRGLLALALMGRGELRIDAGDLANAAQDLAMALDIATMATDAVGVAEAHRLTARLALKRAGYDEALREAHEAHISARGLGNTLLEAESAAACALALRGMGRDGEAAGYRTAAAKGFCDLGAKEYLARFDREWSAAAA